MLLFVPKAQLYQFRDICRRLDRGKEREHGLVHVPAIRNDLFHTRARQYSPLRTGMLVAHCVVVGVEQDAIRDIERSIGVTMRCQDEGLKNDVVCARCHFTGLASGIDGIAQSSAESGAARLRKLADRNCTSACLCSIGALSETGNRIHPYLHEFTFSRNLTGRAGDPESMSG